MYRPVLTGCISFLLLIPYVYCGIGDLSEATAQNVMYMNLCAGATNPDKCITTHFKYKILKTFEADCSATLFAGNCRATVLAGTEEKVIALLFKGQNNYASFLSSAVDSGFWPFAKTGSLNKQGLVTFSGGGKAGSDYVTAFNKLWTEKGLGAYMLEVWAQYCDWPIVVSGHSLGSCLAQMATQQLGSGIWIKSRIYLYSFASPRCGDAERTIFYPNAELQIKYQIIETANTIEGIIANRYIQSTFAAAVDKSSDKRFRIIWTDDAIPIYPSKNFQHCCFGAYKLMAGGWATCENSEDAACLPYSFALNSGHTAYFSTASADYNSLTCSDIQKFPVVVSGLSG